MVVNEAYALGWERLYTITEDGFRTLDLWRTDGVTIYSEECTSFDINKLTEAMERIDTKNGKAKMSKLRYCT